MNTKVLMLSLVGITALTTAFTVPKVIYGEDNRKDVYEVNDTGLVDVSASTVALISKDKAQIGIAGTVKFDGSTLADAFGLCADEPFAQQPAIANCSGFLVADDIIATAGHCMSSSNCNSYHIVFGFKMNNSSQANLEIPAEDVYSCKEVIAREYTRNQDYALVKLDRPVKGRTPLKLQQNAVRVGDAMTVIGHPSGIPTKISDGANVRALSSGYFVTNLDTYGGNSGSAVFNSVTHEVAGILVRGEQDYVYDSRSQCTRSKICASDACRGEDVTNINYVADALK